MLSKLQNLTSPSASDLQTITVPLVLPSKEEMKLWFAWIESRLEEFAKQGNTGAEVVIISSRRLPFNGVLGLTLPIGFVVWYRINANRVKSINSDDVPIRKVLDKYECDNVYAFIAHVVSAWTEFSDVPVKVQTSGETVEWKLVFEWGSKRLRVQ